MVVWTAGAPPMVSPLPLDQLPGPGAGEAPPVVEVPVFASKFSDLRPTALVQVYLGTVGPLPVSR